MNLSLNSLCVYIIRDCKNPHAKDYAKGLQRIILDREQFANVESVVNTQIDYLLSHISGWRGKNSALIRKSLKVFLMPETKGRWTY